MTLDNLSEPAKMTGDLLSLSVVIATLAKMLPSVAALLTIIWTLIRIYETATVQAAVARIRGRDGE